MFDSWISSELLDQEDAIAWEEISRAHQKTPRDTLPPGVESIPPGPFLAVLLEHYDRRNLNGHDLVRLLKARERQVAHLQAGSYADIDEIAVAAPGDATSEVERLSEAAEFAADEIGAALNLTRRAAEFRSCESADLVDRLPQVWRMLDRGLIDLARARVFLRGTGHVSTEVARSVVAQLADAAPSLTTGQLAHRIRRLCMSTDPEDAAKRHNQAFDDRRFVIDVTEAGTANVHLLDIALADARAIGRKVNGYLISLKQEVRSGRHHDQLRADIGVDLLLGEDKHGKRGTVDIRVDLSTLARLDEEPGEIPGLGPVVADIARQIVDESHRARWRITVVNDDEQATHILTTRRRPTRAISDFIEATRPTCAHPGCRAPAVDCDLDHRNPWANRGPTSTLNLDPLCRHHHRLRHSGWDYRRTANGYEWVSPLGHEYVTRRDPP